MKSERLFLNVVILVVALCMGVVACGEGMGTAFTYQGRLNDDGAPADGLYDFRFRLYDQVSGPGQFGNTVWLDEADVIDGYFTVQLDFVNDPNVFDGGARWLEIGVRPGVLEDPNAYTALTPRQKLTPTPYAGYAASANWWGINNMPDGFSDGVDDVGLSAESDPTVPESVKDGVSWDELSAIPDGFADGVDDIGGADSDWTINGDDMYSGTTGNVGIGTTGPLSKLSVGGDGVADAGVAGQGTAYGVYGYGSNALGIGIYGIGSYAGVRGLDVDSGSWGYLGHDSFGGYFVGDGYFSGNVGIGTAIPSAKLEVVGNVVVSGTVDGVDISSHAASTTAHAANATAHHIAPTSLPPSGLAGGDLSGSYPNPSVLDDSHNHNHTHENAALLAMVASLETRIALLENPPGWHSPELIETDNAGDAYFPQVAFDGSGNAFAVWEQNDEARSNIWSKRYDAVTGWGAAELIETENAGDAAYPQVAVNAGGNAVAVWSQSDGTRNNVWSNSYVPGTGWGIAVLIETDNTKGAFGPQVAVDDSGNAIVVWTQSDAIDLDIWSNCYDAVTGWGAAVLIETNALAPKIGFDDSGNAIAVWRKSDGGFSNIWSNRYVPGTGWGVSGPIETDDGYADKPQVAVDTSGNAIAVWMQSDGTRTNIWSNRYDAVTGWGSAELIETGDAGGVNTPQVAMDGSGNAVAVWMQYDGTSHNIWSNRFDAATGWGAAGLIEWNNAGDAGYPQVAFDGSGNAVAVWKQSDGTYIFNIWSNRYVPGTGWSTAELIETDNSGPAGKPQIAVDSSGNAIAVWSQSDGGLYNIWSNRYVPETGGGVQ